MSGSPAFVFDLDGTLIDSAPDIAAALNRLMTELERPVLALSEVRRMIGVGAFIYVLAHLTSYAAQQNFNMAMVVSEIVLRYYLTIGFCALLILAVLAATSTDAMIRRLGAKRWNRLHRIVYLAAALGLTALFTHRRQATAQSSGAPAAGGQAPLPAGGPGTAAGSTALAGPARGGRPTPEDSEHPGPQARDRTPAS